ncbi:MAG: Sua5/YciO/YrdC/YwlC family protein, partial [Bacteroidota bacterium]|nr:Sua5/YciO/YrdC/YwlC family protein [Bacteroidota bacterium]
NLSDEPTIIDDSEAEKKLMTVADSLVSYNRNIHNRADDSVIRIINGKISLIRRSRGYVPRPVDLNFNVEGILALGAEQKNSFCLGKNFQAIMSQYIGDLKNVATYDFFEESIDRFSVLFRFRPKYVACDMHPDYFSTKYASKLREKHGIPVVNVQHHHAHIVSCMAEYGLEDRVIGISMDGTGYGSDGNIWGSEFMIADAGHFDRYTHFDYVPMPGGDAAAEEPWRMAFSYLFKYFNDTFDYESLPVFRSVGQKDLTLIREMIQKNINCPLTSGAGRLFDAVSALTGLCIKAGFDSEAPMRLESTADKATDLCYPFSIEKTVSFKETFRSLLSDLKVSDISLISAKFHNTIAQIILEVAERMKKEYSLNKVVLSGGVFQNKYLLEKAVRKLKQNRFMVFTNHLIPSNDGGISLGQLVVASKTYGLCV